MNITPQQMGALAAGRCEGFLDRLAAFVERKTQRAPQRADLAALFERSAGHGLVSEQHVAAYILLAWVGGARRDRPDPPWIHEVMAETQRAPDDKIAAIFARADALRAAQSAARGANA